MFGEIASAGAATLVNLLGTEGIFRWELAKEKYRSTA